MIGTVVRTLFWYGGPIIVIRGLWFMRKDEQ